MDQKNWATLVILLIFFAGSVAMLVAGAVALYRHRTTDDRYTSWVKDDVYRWDGFGRAAFADANITASVTASVPTSGLDVLSLSDARFYGVGYERGRFATKIAWKMGYLRTDLRNISVPDGDVHITLLLQKGDIVVQVEKLTFPIAQMASSDYECCSLRNPLDGSCIASECSGSDDTCKARYGALAVADREGREAVYDFRCRYKLPPRNWCFVAQRTLNADGSSAYKIDMTTGASSNPLGVGLRAGCLAGIIPDVVGTSGHAYNFTSKRWELSDFYVAVRASDDPFVVESYAAQGDDSLFVGEKGALALLIIGAIFTGMLLLSGVSTLLRYRTQLSTG